MLEAERAEAAGHGPSAAREILPRDCLLHTAERIGNRSYTATQGDGATILETMCACHRGWRTSAASESKIPYKGNSYPALFVRGHGRGPRCMMFCNGLDSVKEMIFLVVRDTLRAARGVSCLMVDQPGVGGSVASARAECSRRVRALGQRRSRLSRDSYRRRRESNRNDGMVVGWLLCAARGCL